jgi:hypothetical protein
MTPEELASKELASKLYLEITGLANSLAGHVQTAIRATILAERERCAKVAETFAAQHEFLKGDPCIEFAADIARIIREAP